MERTAAAVEESFEVDVEDMEAEEHIEGHIEEREILQLRQKAACHEHKAQEQNDLLNEIMVQQDEENSLDAQAMEQELDDGAELGIHVEELA